MNWIKKVISLILIGLALYFISFVVIIASLIYGVYPFYIPFIIGTAIALFLFIINRFFTILNTKLTRLLERIGLVIWFILLVGMFGYNQYLDRLPTLETQEPDMSLYQPFDNDGRVASLDQNASFQLTDNLPRLDGATALYPLYAAFAQAVYPEGHYDMDESAITLSTTPNAYDKLISGQADIIFVAGPSERQLVDAEQQGVTLNLTPIGKEAFVFFVHHKNPVDSLTVEQIQAIYNGEITSWSELGGEKSSIRAFQRPKDSGSQTALENLMGEKKLIEAPTEDQVDGMGGIISETASYRNYRRAIGYSFRYFAMDLVENDSVKFLKINGVYPSKETIANGQYPLSSYFYAVTTDQDNPIINEFLDWILSEEGQLLIEKTGYVPLN
ncbi:PstS family phosphate ABC transporter substrate-binding protein [Amphibacillus sediminis]|uniref:PstS family phosphate ABC transporter substrate-binding protein n=1 Tax=Amphibacillus sediminis TaxID=360185 RepID=UPI0008315A33|nr:substrate-binding domain-containing protein [Amphibacillus sediminis]